MSTLSEVVARMDAGARGILTGSSDRDEVVAVCTESLRPHALLLHSRHGPLATDLRHRDVGGMSFNRLRYGTSVTVAPAGPQEETFLLTLPLSGRGRLRYGRDETVADRGSLYVIGPYQRFQLDFEDAYDQLVVRLDRRRVEEVAAGIPGAEGVAPVELPLSLGPIPGTFLDLLHVAFDLPEALAGQESFARHLEEILIESLLLPHADLSRASTEAGSRAAGLVRRARAYVLEHLDEPISMTALATACGVGIRSLQLAFRSETGMTPTAWLRAVRLDRIRRVLDHAESRNLSVSEVASRHGFLHLGEFARHYRERFGESPSATARRHR